MTKKKIRKLINKISYYGMYCDCIARVLNEFIENGDNNLSSTDIPNLSELLAKYANRLYKNIVKIEDCFDI